MRELVFALSLTLTLPLWPATAQDIPRDGYLRYMPLDYPRVVRQTGASAAFNLYGDRSSPSYQDEDLNGIDDRRQRVLLDLSVRFSPYMVRNTEIGVPMEFRRFWNQGSSYPLFIDTWNLAPSGSELTSIETINFVTVADDPCEAGPVPATIVTNDDCRLLALLQEFDPDNPTNPRLTSAAVDAVTDPFKVLFFDFPGRDAQSWKEAYRNPATGKLRPQYLGFKSIYSHPFINEVRSNREGLLGYEFILQYWFFYPFNDGANNHLGDWEHINVLLAPKGRVTDYLTEQDVQAILSGQGVSDGAGDEMLVIQRIDYYFHGKVMIFDFARPNVYQDRAAWQAELDTMTIQRVGAERFLKETRKRAYVDDAETIINTHPIAFIGAENKGLDQLLQMPGGSNQDSHGTFPIPGLYKAVGPSLSAEQIPTHFDYRKYFREASADGANLTEVRRRWDYVEFFDDSTRVQLIPDWERVHPLVHTNANARREWSWMVLPIRYGFPAAASPGAGLVDHAEMGNLAVVGPQYNSGWNRAGATRGYGLYDPNSLPSIFPTVVQDQYQNSLGFLNATLPTWINLPPLDIIWRVFALPVRAIFKRQDPIYFPAEQIPARFMNVEGEVLYTKYDKDWGFVVFAATGGEGAHLDELDSIAREIDTTVTSLGEMRFNRDEVQFKNSWGWEARLSLHLGNRFVSQNGIRNSRSDMRVTLRGPGTPDAMFIDSELNLWEYAGYLRFNLSTGATQPFFKFGYGHSWYRAQNITVNGDTLQNSTGPWINEPTGLLDFFLPNTLRGTLGIEFLPILNFSAPPRGWDLGLIAEGEFAWQKLGINIISEEIAALELQEETLLLSVIGDANPTATRVSLLLGLTVGF